MSTGKDIALILENNCWDIRLADGDLVGDDGLETAVAVSLFTDKRVTDEQLPELETDKKGWWGDMISEVNQDQIGSRIWTLKRSKVSNETLRLYEDYSREALQHLIEDGVARSITVSANYNDDFILLLDIIIERPNRDKTKFNVLWDNQEARILNEGTTNGI